MSRSYRLKSAKVYTAVPYHYSLLRTTDQGLFLQIHVLPIRDKHMPRLVRDADRRLRLHDDSLRRDAACPEDGNLARADRHGVAEVGAGHVAEGPPRRRLQREHAPSVRASAQIGMASW